MTPTQNETIRQTALQVLAIRHPAAITTRQVNNRIATEIDFKLTEDDTNAALEYLRGLTPPLVKILPNELGTTKHWQATTEGVQAWEKNQPLSGQ